MSQELMYTSVPAGLKPGSRGFCTVAATPELPVSVAERLEALSAYRHVFAAHDANESLNPVVYSHLKLSVSGRACHVLSRVCAADLDYTQRSNKFAHHVILDPIELPAAGPAWLFSQPGFLETRWSGEPRILPVGRRAPAGQVNSSICSAWQRVAGDAGWGGVLAESVAAGARAGAIVIYRPGMDVLPLVAESMALLPAEQRWEVTFSTYFTKLPPGMECRWRFVLEGSPEAVIRSPGCTVIDLCNPLGHPSASVWVEAARSGIAPKNSRRRAPVGIPAIAFANSGLTIQEPDAEWGSEPTGQEMPDLHGLLPPVVLSPSPLHADHFQNRGTEISAINGATRRRRSWFPLAALIACALILIVSIGVTTRLLWRANNAKPTGENSDSSASQSPPKNETADKASNPAKGVELKANVPPTSTEATSKTAEEKPSAAQPAPTPAGEMKSMAASVAENNLQSASSSDAPIDALSAFRKLPSIELRPYQSPAAGITSDDDAVLNFQTIGPIDGDPSKISVELLGLNVLFPSGGGRNSCLSSDEHAAGAKLWNVRLHNPSTTEDFKPSDVAQIKLENGELKFAWLAQAGRVKGVNQLRNAVLQISDGVSKPVEVALRSAAEVKALDFEPKRNGDFGIRHWPFDRTSEKAYPDFSLLRLSVDKTGSALPRELELVKTTNTSATFSLGDLCKVNVVVSIQQIDEHNFGVGFNTAGEIKNAAAISDQLQAIDRDLNTNASAQVGKIQQKNLTADSLSIVLGELNKALGVSEKVVNKYHGPSPPGALESHGQDVTNHKNLGQFRDAIQTTHDLLNQLELNGRLEFTIYADIDGRRVDLLIGRIKT